MQQFTVPQFIDVEDKIIGPITARQFIIILASFLIAGISYKIFDFTLFLTVSLFILLFCIFFAFIKINGRPFHFFVLNLTQTLKRPHLRVWINKGKKSEIDFDWKKKDSEILPPAKVKIYTKSRLNELSLIVDTRGVYRGEPGDAKARLKSNKQVNNKLEGKGGDLPTLPVQAEQAREKEG